MTEQRCRVIEIGRGKHQSRRYRVQFMAPVLETGAGLWWQAAVIEGQFGFQPVVAGDEGALGRLWIAADRIGAEKSGQCRREFGGRIGLAVRGEEETGIVGVTGYACAVRGGSVMQQGLPLTPFRQTSGGGVTHQLRKVGGISAGPRYVERKAKEQ